MKDEKLWSAGEAYEPYIGRWSRLVAHEFVGWLAPSGGKDWVDVGCGTGELTRVILAAASPRLVRGFDPSEAFTGYARERVPDERATFATGDAMALPADDASADFVVSGLVLNFVPDPKAALAEFRRVARVGGTVAAYVWDYGGDMQMLRYFFDAASEIDPAGAREHDEALLFPICRPDRLEELFASSGLNGVQARAIDVETRFANFDDFWTPFLSGGAPAPKYLLSLPEERRAALRELLRTRLPAAGDGTITLIARAWAVKGTASRD